ncbi:phosphate-starvation-inducible PsiE family protein [Ruegeria jejuensis]|uniref:phosphate-starvation-inducible PsiE family protein n=1 Tax=Ruegeria jejuensis TaxID=3233338 RepID=UPI00355B689D
MSSDDQEFHIELDPEHEDPVIRVSNVVIRQLTRALSILMVLVIAWTILDAFYTFGVRVIETPALLVEGEDLLVVLGAVLSVLIAIEVYTNAALYLTSNVIHVRLVVATGLMAIARKVITFDYKQMDPGHIAAYAGLALALGIAYWLSGK